MNTLTTTPAERAIAALSGAHLTEQEAASVADMARSRVTGEVPATFVYADGSTPRIGSDGIAILEDRSVSA